MDATTVTPSPRNEPQRTYAPGTAERASLRAALADMAGRRHELPVTVDGRRYLPSGPSFDVVTPHAHAHVLGRAATATREDAKAAVEAALRGRPGVACRTTSARPCCCGPRTCCRVRGGTG